MLQEKGTTSLEVFDGVGEAAGAICRDAGIMIAEKSCTRKSAKNEISSSRAEADAGYSSVWKYDVPENC
jgi:hypothetical protein